MTDDELRIRIRKMREHFLWPPSDAEVFGELDSVVSPLRPPYQAAAKAFRHSLSSALSTVAIPFALASASIAQSHLQRLHIAERIRGLKILDPGEEEEPETETEREAAYAAAASKMGEFMQSKEGRDVVRSDVCEFLLSSLNHGLVEASQELLQQGLVLLWSAFEVLCRDIFEILLNEDPSKIQGLINHPTTRKRSEAERLPLDTLVLHGFNLSSRLGTVLVSQQDFSDLHTIKAVYPVLYPGNDNLNQALAHRGLWTLYQQRHLIVHRRGLVDRAYVEATGETVEVGCALNVSPGAIEEALRVVVACGAALVRCLPAGKTGST